MLKIETIGTGNIVSEFIDACRYVQGVKITSLYSHSLEKAKFFASKNNLLVHIVDNFEDILDYIDIIYIASPNGLHYQQAKYFLQQQKHEACFNWKTDNFFCTWINWIKTNSIN